MKKKLKYILLTFLMWLIIGLCCSEMTQGVESTANDLCLSAWMLFPVFVLNAVTE